MLHVRQDAQDWGTVVNQIDRMTIVILLSYNVEEAFHLRDFTMITK